MFVQVIQGQVADAEGLRDGFDRWVHELAPGATGWLGSTGGVTEDGMFIGLARFASADAASRNSDRPEQGQWWTEMSKHFAGEVTFRDSLYVTPDIVGDPDEARFVQIMQGRSSDPERGRELLSQNSEEWAAFRPDVLGSLAIDHEDGEYTMAIYFTSESEAREGERKEMPGAVKAQMEELNKLAMGEVRFFDLKEPWLYSPS